jgi:hypothetical protein
VLLETEVRRVWQTDLQLSFMMLLRTEAVLLEREKTLTRWQKLTRLSLTTAGKSRKLFKKLTRRLEKWP